MLVELDDYDWHAVFGYAGEDGSSITGHALIESVPDDQSSTGFFTREDVMEVTGKSEGENDGAEWMIYGQLWDGRWFYIEAGCDYTGWG